MSKGNNLLIFNYAMDPTDPIFSHQLDAVTELSSHFKKIFVLTSRSADGLPLPHNVKVLSSRWRPGQPLRGAFRFTLNLLFVLIRYSPNVTFSHMTEVQSTIAAPLLRLLRIPHYLWYAHVSPSKYIKWSHFWCTGVITSTEGSCPIKSKKVHAIGQAINPKDFQFTSRQGFGKKFIHIGRLDPSKNLDKIIDLLFCDENAGHKFRLLQIGSPSSPKFNVFKEEIFHKYHKLLDSGSLNIISSISRKDIPKQLSESDVFIHAFQGSLDKTLVEATMTGLPVVTINREYRIIFGSWASDPEASLQQELEGYLSLMEGDYDMESELHRRHMVALTSHSQDHWVCALAEILQSTK
jgi:glycosyltransferase involved in cell wall biosynthesis